MKRIIVIIMASILLMACIPLETEKSDFYTNQGGQSGRHVYIYQFGGEGNDWCFVRTPFNYDPEGEPRPLVIVNHGNGWVMNGGLKYANYSSKTMYGVDEQNNERYLNEDDPNYLLYSNPTIEALLESGYVVAGTNNYADVLYGNKNNRDALKHFYYHMTIRYNVEPEVYMIGASNGFMTTMNGAFLLGTKVKAVIGQYPLVNLKHSYLVDHPGGVMNAYGVTTKNNITEFEGKTYTHDPMTWVGTRSYVPAVKIWWSSTDVGVPQYGHTVPFMELLRSRNNPNEVFEDVQVDKDGETKEHGHWEHFDPYGVVEFFNRIRNQ